MDRLWLTVGSLLGVDMLTVSGAPAYPRGGAVLWFLPPSLCGATPYGHAMIILITLRTMQEKTSERFKRRKRGRMPGS